MIDLFFQESLGRPNLLHYDGEFSSPEDLVRAGLLGRNMGWLAHEKSTAISHIAQVVRREFTADEETFGFSLLQASDSQILEAIAELVSDYMRSLEFAKDAERNFSGSPYDWFLAKNRLPQKPNPGESSPAYALRLLESVERLSNPEWVDEGRMRRHEQEFRFGPTELQGMKIFLKSGPRGSIRDFAHLRAIGNCASCHAPPAFTDFTFRNTGVSQEEYDAVHGRGAFVRMEVPSLAERLQMDSARLADFAGIPSYSNTRSVDLGAWNQLQSGMKGHLFSWICQAVPGCLSTPSERAVEDAAIAAFKTPTLRNLGHSAPYLHNGSRPSLESATMFYAFMANLARDGRMRNADPEMLKIFIDGRDVGPLAAFMRALNEEYE
jgi:cytochrome c peroxidase